MQKVGKHFVLVHGACHGAWCWYKVTTLLKSAGHKVTALDLAACGIHPKQVHELRTLSDYFEPLVKFMASLPLEEKVILVGHSMGGFSISAAVERFPEKVSTAVFCTAFMPSPDLRPLTLVEEVRYLISLSLVCKSTHYTNYSLYTYIFMHVYEQCHISQLFSKILILYDKKFIVIR